MEYELVVQSIGRWVTQYVAAFCLVTLVIVVVGRYWWSKRFDTPVRDYSRYLLGIALLTLVLAFMPTKTNSVLWPPVTWFSFTMLLMLELLWLSFLLDGLIKALVRLPRWFARKVRSDAPTSMPSGTPYSRK